MINTPLVSIIIPVYNAENYLDETIRCAINQTWPNKELIIIDDFSTDKSLAIAKKYENNWVKVLSQPNSGASVARNNGLNIAKGEYIQFLDADDLLSENKIEVQIKLLLGFPEHLALCTTVHFQDGIEPKTQPVQHEWYADGSNDPADFLVKLYGGALIGPIYGGMIQPNSWLTPRNLIDKAGLWNEMRNPDDDGEFFCRVILASKGIVYATDAVNYYRKFKTSNNLSGKNDYESASSILKSTDSKSFNLLAHTNRPEVKIVLGRLYYENAFSFYPYYKNLVTEAELKAKNLAPEYRFTPYKNGLKNYLAKVFGWKMVRHFEYLKSKIWHY